MSIITATIAAGLATLVLSTSCAKPAVTAPTAVVESKPAGATLSRADVSQIAIEQARLQGLDPLQFNELEARYEVNDQGGVWWVFFVGHDQRHVGDHFAVRIDDQTREAQFHGGA